LYLLAHSPLRYVSPRSYQKSSTFQTTNREDRATMPQPMIDYNKVGFTLPKCIKRADEVHHSPNRSQEIKWAVGYYHRSIRFDLSALTGALDSCGNVPYTRVTSAILHGGCPLMRQLA
jgi:hypothetical protein